MTQVIFLLPRQSTCLFLLNASCLDILLAQRLEAGIQQLKKSAQAQADDRQAVVCLYVMTALKYCDCIEGLKDCSLSAALGKCTDYTACDILAHTLLETSAGDTAPETLCRRHCMDRTTPVAHKEEIELYIRTYYSLLRSSGPVRIRSLEDTHAAMDSSLHYHADSSEIDIAALVYCALRLPACIPNVSLLIMGQMEEVFWREGYHVDRWQPVRAPARRRKLYYNADQKMLAAYIASVSDIDDMIPCLTAYQIEWNKLHRKLMRSALSDQLKKFHRADSFMQMDMLEMVRDALDLSPANLFRLSQLWPGQQMITNLQFATEHELDIRVQVLGSGLSDYRRSVQTWWRKVEHAGRDIDLARRPIYFCSSNTHSIINTTIGFDDAMQDEVLNFVKRENPEDLYNEYDLLTEGNEGQLRNFLYYTTRLYRKHPSCTDAFIEKLNTLEREAGVIRNADPHCLDVEAQIIDMRQLRPDRLDPRLHGLSEADWALLQQSDALIFNIDYPLGMSAYHIFSQVSTAAQRILGVYILGKAATLNGRVGDVMIPNVVYDEHSRNSYLFRNCFTAQDVSPLLNYGTVFDNQKAVTVRGTLLQNRNFMHVFYEEGYTDIEMEAGPYLSGLYEDIYPKRYPDNEIVNLFINAPYDIGLMHYASDTPISKRQSLLSKSLSYFGVDATYATTIALMRRILKQEVSRQRKRRSGDQFAVPFSTPSTTLSTTSPLKTPSALDPVAALPTVDSSTNGTSDGKEFDEQTGVEGDDKADPVAKEAAPQTLIDGVTTEPGSVAPR